MTDDALLALATDIQAEHAAALAADSAALGQARRCGDLLIGAKRGIGHGGCWPFVRQWCSLSKRVAQMYMMIALGWPSIEEQMRISASHFSIRDALALLQRKGERRERPVPRVHWNASSADEHRELRRITDEMNTFRYVSRTFTECPDSSGFDIFAGCGGAPVYFDIVGGDPQSGRPVFRYTRGEVCAKLNAFIDGGPRSVVSDLAVDVAK